MIDREQHVRLTEARELFGPLAKLKLRIGNCSRTTCNMFTAGGFFIIKTNTGAPTLRLVSLCQLPRSG
jgi:hypothetical protein